MTTEIFPIIDVSENLGDFSSKSSDIVKACTNWGFFVLVGYGIPHEVVDRMHELVSTEATMQICYLPRRLTRGIEPRISRVICSGEKHLSD